VVVTIVEVVDAGGSGSASLVVEVTLAVVVGSGSGDVDDVEVVDPDCSPATGVTSPGLPDAVETTSKKSDVPTHHHARCRDTIPKRPRGRTTFTRPKTRPARAMREKRATMGTRDYRRSGRQVCRHAIDCVPTH
jgi:hypothetical protein